MKLITVKTNEEMSKKAGEFYVSFLNEHPNAVLGLATGSTPLGLYAYLADAYRAGKVSFKGVRAFNLDEYYGISPENDQSYRYFMRENLFQHVDIQLENTFIPNGLAKDADAECARYSKLLAENPRDIQLLGIGHNGHIAFNEPGTPFSSTTQVIDLQEATIQANARFFASKDDVPKKAFTMGIREITDAKCVVMLVSGKGKADTLKRLVHGEVDESFPASVLKNHPNFIVFADADASAKL